MEVVIKKNKYLKWCKYSIFKYIKKKRKNKTKMKKKKYSRIIFFGWQSDVMPLKTINIIIPV